MQVWIDLGAILIPFFMVAALGPRAVRFCRQQGLVVPIDARRAHAKPTPHGGGILLVATIVPLGLLAVWGLGLAQPVLLTALLLASVPVAVVGWCDDKYQCPAWVRLGVHLMAVAVGLYFMPPLFDFVPVWAEKIILLLAWGWFVNLYNFMDGLDGLTTAQAIFLGAALAFLVPQLKLLGAIIAGAGMGFLRVNWSPAKVFMGDVGSTFLGYLLGGLLLLALVDHTTTMVYPIFTLTLVFSVDATYTLIKRLVQGHKPWVPHREFWFHRAAKLGFSHAQIVRRVVGLNLLLFIIVLVGLQYQLGPITLVFGLLLLLWPARAIQQMERYGKR